MFRNVISTADFADHGAFDSVLIPAIIQSDFAVGAEVGVEFRGRVDSQATALKFVDSFPWQLFYKKGLPVPDIRVRVHDKNNSRKGDIGRVLRESFANYAGDPIVNAVTPPRITFRSSEKNAYIMVDAGGSFMNLHGFTPFSKVSRLNVPEVCASSAISRVVIPRLAELASSSQHKIHVWDPFCGSGMLPIAMSRIMAGIPAGSPAIPYPFMSYPSHDPTVLGRYIEEMQIVPHPVSHSVRLSGTDSSLDAIEIAKDNWNKFNSMVPQTSSGSSLSVDISLERVFDNFTAPSGSNRLFIFTALPAGGNVSRKYKHFHALVQSLHRENRLVGCVVLTTKSRIFRSLSEQRWIVRDRYFDVRGEVEVLELVR